MHARILGRPALRLVACLAAAALAAGCDEPKPSTSAPTTNAAQSAAPDAPPEPPKRKTMPELLVDAMGPYVDGRRIDMKAEDAADKLAKVIKELPIEGKPVALLVDKKAKTSDVAAVVTELGAAGAPKVLLKTDGRNDLPKEIEVTPEGRISSPAPCTVTTMVMKDLSTAIWSYKGGLGKRQRKGLAGPDLSQTGEQLTKDIAACSATIVFFSADETLPWEMAYNLAGTALKSDEKKKIEALVLLRITPVAGRPVKLWNGS